MKDDTLANKIMMRMNEQPKGYIFTNNDFYDLGKVDAIRKSLSRLCNMNDVVRLMDGYYTIPYFIELLQEYSYPSSDELAKKIAEKYAWNICPSGETALNQVGLSTQVPVVCEYMSDGPYRKYDYLNTSIIFKHTSNRNISRYSKPVSLLLQSIKAIGKENLSKRDIQRLALYTRKYVKEDLLKQTKSSPAWIYEVIKEICEVNNDE